MTSITDCVVEALKYPFNDVKGVLGIGALFAILNLISLGIGTKTLDAFRFVVDVTQATNSTLTTLQYSQLPIADIKFIIGLAVVSFIISLFVMGYQYDVIRFSIDRRDDLPGFTDIINLFIKGIKYFIVALAYTIIPAIVFGLGVIAGDSTVFIAVALVSMLLFIIAFFLMIMALNNMVAYDDLKKAFDFSGIIANISNLGWVKYLGIVIFTMIVYMIITAAAGFILSLISVLFAATVNNQAIVVSAVITVIEGLFVTSYCTIFYNRVCGSIYRESIK